MFYALFFPFVVTDMVLSGGLLHNFLRVLTGSNNFRTDEQDDIDFINGSGAFS